MNILKPTPCWHIVTAAVIAGLVGAIAAAYADDDDTVAGTLARRAPVTTWQCGAVTLQYETISGPGWYRTTYRVINPDAISYDRSYGPPRYFVEWTGVDGRGEMLTLNGWPCRPARL